MCHRRGDLPAADVVPLVISHRHGEDIEVYATEEPAWAGAAQIARSNWISVAERGAGVQIGATVGRDAGGRGLHRADVNQAIHHAVHQPAHQVGADNSVLRAVLVYASQQCTGS